MVGWFAGGAGLERSACACDWPSEGVRLLPRLSDLHARHGPARHPARLCLGRPHARLRRAAPFRSLPSVDLLAAGAAARTVVLDSVTDDGVLCVVIRSRCSGPTAGSSARRYAILQDDVADGGGGSSFLVVRQESAESAGARVVGGHTVPDLSCPPPPFDFRCCRALHDLRRRGGGPPVPA